MTVVDKTLISLMTKLCSQKERLKQRTGGQKSSEDMAFFGEIPAPQSTLTHVPSQDRGRGNSRRFQGGRSRSRGRGQPFEGRNSRFADSNGSSRKRGGCFNCGPRVTGQTTAGMNRTTNHTTPAGNPRRHRQLPLIFDSEGEIGERRHG
jgi:hypothetical protein